MQKSFFLIIFLLPIYVFSQGYKVSDIPDSLKENANVVKRIEYIKVTIKDINKAIITHKWAYTILNEAGDEYSLYQNYYDKFVSLSDITGRMFDAGGVLLKTIKRKDIADIAVNDGESLVNDARKKRFAFYNKVYPYTVEYEDEEEYKGIFDLPDWHPINDDHLSVQESILEVETPADYQLRYKQFCYTGDPKKEEGSKIKYTWKLSNQKAIKEELFQPDWHLITPTVFLAPSSFEIGGYKGTMDSWNNFGKFIADLIKDRQALPDNIKQEVHRLTDNKTDREKIEILYKYFQENTRYIGIQLGIGGWQPFDANYVAKNKYGDCKALSNYMVSLLREAGIKANYVTVYANENYRKTIPDFPMNSFNHVIACVPTPKDTTWIECTSQTISLGYLGESVCNRQALLIDEDGGHLVNTPVYSKNNNQKIRKVNATIDAEGNLTAEVFTHFTGIMQERVHWLFHHANKEEQEKYLNRAVNLPTYKIEKYQFNEDKGSIPAMDEYLKIVSPNYASVSGKRIFIQPNLFNKVYKLDTYNERKFNVEIDNSTMEIDSLDIKIPDGYKLETLPKDENISNEFGEYKMKYKMEGNIIHLIRIQEENSCKRPAATYSTLVSFYDSMYKADRAKVVFTKNTD